MVTKLYDVELRIFALCDGATDTSSGHLSRLNE